MALFGEHALEAPFVLRLIAPSYYHACRGLEQLRRGEALINYQYKKPSEGLKEISPILLKRLREKLHIPTNVTDIKIDMVTFHSQMSWDNEPIESFGLIDISVESQGLKKIYHDWTGALIYNNFYLFSDLQRDVEKFKEPNLLLFCFGLFLLGSVLDVFAFFDESKETDK
jgi:hypothetical protein